MKISIPLEDKDGNILYANDLIFNKDDYKKSLFVQLLETGIIKVKKESAFVVTYKRIDSNFHKISFYVSEIYPHGVIIIDVKLEDN